MKSHLFTGPISRDESASATFILKESEGDEEINEEWLDYHRLQPSYNEFEFRNGQVCVFFFFF